MTWMKWEYQILLVFMKTKHWNSACTKDNGFTWTKNKTGIDETHTSKTWTKKTRHGQEQKKPEAVWGPRTPWLSVYTYKSELMDNKNILKVYRYRMKIEGAVLFTKRNSVKFHLLHLPEHPKITQPWRFSIGLVLDG